MLLAGRGFGKTRTGAEDVSDYARRNSGTRIALVAPTTADARDTMVEGESGLLSVTPRSAIKTWNRSLGELVCTNGTRFKLFSGDEPNRLRGPQHHRAWVDELAAFRYAEAWDQLMFGLRLGQQPQVVVTTTPRPTRLLKELVADPRTYLTRGSTFENAAHLAPVALDQLKARYEGTRLGRQELEAEILEDVEGALWTIGLIDEHRVNTAPELLRVVVAVDPAVTSQPDSDETGILVCGKGVDGHAYVLSDRSVVDTPDGWARRAVHAYDQFSADRLIGEANNGGDLVETVIRTISPRVSYSKVVASRGKQTRAEPVVALYEQGRVHHVGAFPQLEQQMTEWVPESGKSPDRVDALVWALTDLLLVPERKSRAFVA